MENQAVGHREWGRFFFRMALIGLSALVTLKVVFFFIDIDEQYAVTMAYRMVRGDRMFLEMWEPHQTSGFLAALLIRIYILVTGGVEGVVIYLRLAGVFFQGMVSLFLYDTLKRFCSRDAAFAAAIFYYNTLAKYNQSIDFANMLMWFSMLMLLCLLRFFMVEKGRKSWLVLAGISASLLVLSYPTCLLAVFPVCFGIWYMGRGRERWINTGIYLGTCGLCGAAWLAYFLAHMTVQDFVYGVSQMLTDGSHSATIAQKLVGYRGDLIRILPYAAVSFAIALIAWGILRVFMKKSYSFLMMFLFWTMAEQLYVWLTMSHHIKFPALFYYILLAIGIYRYRKRDQYGIDRNNRVYQALFWFGSVTALGVLLAALLASNMCFFESNEYMMIGFVAAFAYLDYENRQAKRWWILLVLGLFCVAAFRKGYLMHYVWGKDTVFVTKQKALEGPLKGVYCRYTDGYDYNMKGLVTDQYIPKGSTVMYVGVETLIYLQGEYEISNFSTISTPYINERLFEYWERYPEKYPEYIIWDFKVPYESKPSAEVKERMLGSGELLVEDEGIQIYKIQRADGRE